MIDPGEEIVIFGLKLFEQRIKRSDAGTSWITVIHRFEHVEPRRALPNVLLILPFKMVKPVPYLAKECKVVGEDEQLSGILGALTDEPESKIQRIGVKA